MWLNTFFLSGFPFFTSTDVLTFKFYFKQLSSLFLQLTSRLSWVASRRECDLWCPVLRLSLAILQSQLSRCVRSKMGDTLWRTITQRCDKSTTGKRPQKKRSSADVGWMNWADTLLMNTMTPVSFLVWVRATLPPLTPQAAASGSGWWAARFKCLCFV